MSDAPRVAHELLVVHDVNPAVETKLPQNTSTFMGLTTVTSPVAVTCPTDRNPRPPTPSQQLHARSPQNETFAPPDHGKTKMPLDRSTSFAPTPSQKDFARSLVPRSTRSPTSRQQQLQVQCVCTAISPVVAQRRLWASPSPPGSASSRPGWGFHSGWRVAACASSIFLSKLLLCRSFRLSLRSPSLPWPKSDIRR